MFSAANIGRNWCKYPTIKSVNITVVGKKFIAFYQHMTIVTKVIALSSLCTTPSYEPNANLLALHSFLWSFGLLEHIIYSHHTAPEHPNPSMKKPSYITTWCGLQGVSHGQRLREVPMRQSVQQGYNLYVSWHNCYLITTAVTMELNL